MECRSLLYCNTYCDNFVCVYVASCLWSMMFIQHCFLILYSFAVHRTHTVHVCINASLDCPFNSNIGGGEITSFPTTGKVTSSSPATSPCHSIFEAFASLHEVYLIQFRHIAFSESKVGTYDNRGHQDNQIIGYVVLRIGKTWF